MGIYKREKIWYIDYYLPGGKRTREAAGTSKKLAEQLLAKRKAEILDGKFDVNRPDAILFTEFAEEFLEYAQTTKKEKTYLFHKNSLIALNSYFKESCIGKITPYDIEQFKVKISFR